MNHDQFTALVKALPGDVYDTVDGWGIKDTEYEGENGKLYMVDGFKLNAEGEREPWNISAFVPNGTEAITAVTLMLQKLSKKETNL